jgi:hypothetical protein
MEKPIGCCIKLAAPPLLPRFGPTAIDAAQICFGFVILAGPQSPMLRRTLGALRLNVSIDWVISTACYPCTGLPFGHTFATKQNDRNDPSRCKIKDASEEAP